MSIGIHDQQTRRTALSRAAGVKADARAVADAASVEWHRVAAQLAPLISESGVAALYARCLHLRGITNTSAAPAEPQESAFGSFHAVWQHIAARSPEDAIEAGVAFFDTFIKLLGSLIGVALTARLLNPVWADGHPDQPAQEN